MAKSELWKFKPLGWMIDGLGSFPVRRGEADREAVRRGPRPARSAGCGGHIPRGDSSARGQAWPTADGGGSVLPSPGRDHDPRGAARHQSHRAEPPARVPAGHRHVRASGPRAGDGGGEGRAPPRFHRPVLWPPCRHFSTRPGRPACRPTPWWVRDPRADPRVRIGRVLLGSGARPAAGQGGRGGRARPHPHPGPAHPQSFRDRLTGRTGDRGRRRPRCQAGGHDHHPLARRAAGDHGGVVGPRPDRGGRHLHVREGGPREGRPPAGGGLLRRGPGRAGPSRGARHPVVRGSGLTGGAGSRRSAAGASPSPGRRGGADHAVAGTARLPGGRPGAASTRTAGLQHHLPRDRGAPAGGSGHGVHRRSGGRGRRAQLRQHLQAGRPLLGRTAAHSPRRSSRGDTTRVVLGRADRRRDRRSIHPPRADRGGRRPPRGDAYREP